jgi:hypothetical protein
MTVRLASIRGYAHRYRGLPRQDNAGIALHMETNTLVFAVADGVGGAERSHVGAHIACEVGVQTVLSELDSSRTVEWAYVLRTIGSEMERHASRLLDWPADADATEKLLGTTIVIGIVRRGPACLTTTLVRVGDSGAWLLRDGVYQALLGSKLTGPEPIMSSAVRALPQTPAVTPVHIDVPPGAVLLVGTDGFGDPLGDGVGLVGALFAKHLRVPPPLLAMGHLLDFSRETFDDDRTLLAVWPVE